MESEDLDELSEKMNDFQNDVKDKLSELYIAIHYQNNLLKKLCFYFEKQLNYKQHKSNLIISELDSYRDKNLLIAGVAYDEVYLFIKQLAEPSVLTKGQSAPQDIKAPEYGAVCFSNDLAAVLTNVKAGDYVLINYDDLTESAIAKLIEAIRYNALNITVGQGNGARSVKFNLTRANYVIYAEILETVNPELLNLCEVIK